MEVTVVCVCDSLTHKTHTQSAPLRSCPAGSDADLCARKVRFDAFEWQQNDIFISVPLFFLHDVIFRLFGSFLFPREYVWPSSLLIFPLLACLGFL